MDSQAKMKACVVFLLAAGVSLFTLAESLKCYSCPDGTAERCEGVQQCSAPENSCLILTSDKGVSYAKCIRSSDCGFEKLAASFPVSKFHSYCCQSNLCNSAQTIAAKPLIGLLVGLAALCWGMY